MFYLSGNLLYLNPERKKKNWCIRFFLYEHMGKRTFNSCLENPTVKEPGGLQSMGSQRVRHD